MRLSVSRLANGAAWGAFLGLAAVAVVLVVLLGAVGLILLGLATLFVCSQFALDDRAAGWSRHTFAARMADATSPEEQAARAEEHRLALLPVRFYGRCGATLVLAGSAGLAWQVWG